MTPNRRMLNDEEAQVHDHVMRMGQVVSAALEKAMLCFSGHDTGLARDIVASDETANRLQRQIDG